MSKIIKIDSKNTNKHTPAGMELLEKSIKEVGVIESICVDKQGEIITGNARFETFEKLGYKPKIIELSENEYPVIQTELEGEKRVKAAILANTTAHKNFNLDMDLIQEVAVEEYDIDIEGVGVEVIDIQHVNGGGYNDPIKEFNELGEFQYSNENQESYRQLIVNFDNQDDVNRFVAITELKISDKTRTIFFPMKEKGKAEDIYGHH